MTPETFPGEWMGREVRVDGWRGSGARNAPTYGALRG
jgi:hypothetical protein